MKRGLTNFSGHCFLMIFLLLANPGFIQLLAQPWGGPYGPVETNYTMPLISGSIYFVSPDGKSENSGEVFEKPATLEAAVAKSKTGDMIVLRGGTYRTGNLKFNQGITLQPYKNEKPVLKGTYIARGWKKISDDLWVTSWPRLFPGEPEDWWRRDREEQRTPLHRFHDDMVFVDGRFLQSTGSAEAVDTNTFYIDYGNKLVYIGTNPANRLVEITAFNVAIHRICKDYNGRSSDSIGPVIRGIEFTQYADTAILIEGTYPEGLTDEYEYGNDVRGTVLENCDISYCSRIGAYLMGDSLTIRNCKVSNTSTEGIYLVGVSDAILERNVFMRNNIEHLTGYFPAAVKIFNQCHRVTCRDNLVTDLPNSNGIWYDVGNVNGIFVNNWLENVGNARNEKYSVFQYMSGFFFEISKGAICAGNVFLNCDNGSFVLNSCDVELYQNTYINSKAAFGRTDRNPADDHFGWHSETAPGVGERDGHCFMNNLMVRDDKLYAPLLEVWQLPVLCDTLHTLQLGMMDHNVYVKHAEKDTSALIVWSTVDEDSCLYLFNSPSELNEKHPAFSAHDMYFDHYEQTVFQDTATKNFRLSDDFPGLRAAGMLPAKISKILGIETGTDNYIGAYPLLRRD
ncbi:MAG: right-handed parallel beta-helix repeat-containing protein [Bacteroidales bacterium]|nr:right-handed parallel beta-helix repeat-containing protein [Bacteroidales bacterium]